MSERSVWDALDDAVSPTGYRPRVVPGIEWVEQTTRDGVAYVVVHNPAAGKYLKLDPRDFELLQQMDGSRTVQELIDEFFQRYGMLAFARVPRLVHQARESWFLTDPPLDVWDGLDRRVATHRADTMAARLARGFVETRIPIAKADAYIGTVYRRLARPLFSRPAVVVGGVLAVAGPILFAVELFRGRYDLYRLGGSYAAAAVLYGVLTLFAVAIHELGHGCAVVHAGRKVREGGLLIYFGLPSAYVDTSDVWMVPRRARLRTSLAGPWTGLVLGGVAAALTVALPRSRVGAVFFAFTVVFVASELINFNPLLELDGYYMLIDLLEKPLLRPASIRFVRSELGRKLRAHEPLTGEERLFAVFGTASIAYSLLAVGLAFRFYAAHVIPGFRDAWRTNNVGARVAGVILLGLFVAPLVLIAFTLVRRLARSLWLEGRRLRREARRHRHRQLREVLAAAHLWRDLSPARLEELATAMRLDHVRPGQVVVRQGGPADRFWLVVRGALEAVLDGVPSQRLGPGDHFGERSLLGGGTHHRTMVAQGHALLASLDRQEFMEFLGDDLEHRQRLEQTIRYRQAIAGSPLFQDLSPAELDLVLAHMELCSYEPGATMARQGAAADRFGVIVAGSAEVRGDDGAVVELHVGDPFGETALLDVGGDQEVECERTVVAGEAGATALTMAPGDAHDLLARYFHRAPVGAPLSHLGLDRHAALAS